MTGQAITDRGALALVAAALLALAAVLLWHYLELPLAHFSTLAAIGVGTAAVLGWPRARPVAGPLALVACALVGGAAYAVTRSPALLAGPVTTFVAGCLSLWSTARGRRQSGDTGWSIAAWLAVAVSMIVATWALYFELFTAGFASDQVARRLVLTILWAASGVPLVVGGRRRGDAAPRVAGWVLVAAACGKAVFYDTVMLAGLLRVGSLAAAGLLLLAGSLALGLGRQRQALP